MNPDHLRAAIERIGGIEKPSDYTLVMKEAGRMEAEEKLVERVARAIYDQPTTFDGDTIGTHLALSHTIDASTVNVDETREVVMGVCRDAARAACDTLVKTVREVKG